VPPQYDSLLAKVIVCGADRAQALARLRAALSRTVIGGVATTLPILSSMVDDSEFGAGGVGTGYLGGFGAGGVGTGYLGRFGAGAVGTGYLGGFGDGGVDTGYVGRWLEHAVMPVPKNNGETDA
jgi:hypothetical protein